MRLLVAGRQPLNRLSAAAGYLLYVYCCCSCSCTSGQQQPPQANAAASAPVPAAAVCATHGSPAAAPARWQCELTSAPSTADADAARGGRRVRWRSYNNHTASGRARATAYGGASVHEP
jgi:hypothetical protein